MQPRLRLSSLLCAAAAAAVLLTACGGGGDDDGGARTVGGAGALLITRTDGIVERRIDSGEEVTLIARDPVGTPLDPALSPGGDRIAYVVQGPISGPASDTGNDLWVADRDGSDARMITEQEPNHRFGHLLWRDDGHIVAVVSAPEQTDDGITLIAYAIEVIDVKSGERTGLVDETQSFGLSPDGERIVYAATGPADPVTGLTLQTLQARDLAGGDPATIVSPAEDVNPFDWPRFSPDGAQIAFAAADLSEVTAPGRYVSASAAAAAANGFPQDIWLVDAAGGSPRRLADLKEDLPALTWSGDGEHIYVLGIGGLFDVEVATGFVQRLGEGHFHGQLAWAP